MEGADGADGFYYNRLDYSWSALLHSRCCSNSSSSSSSSRTTSSCCCCCNSVTEIIVVVAELETALVRASEERATLLCPAVVSGANPDVGSPRMSSMCSSDRYWPRQLLLVCSHSSTILQCLLSHHCVAYYIVLVPCSIKPVQYQSLCRMKVVYILQILCTFSGPPTQTPDSIAARRPVSSWSCQGPDFSLLTMVLSMLLLLVSQTV